LGLTALRREPGGAISHLDSLRASGRQSHLPGGRLIGNGTHGKLAPYQRKSSQHTETYYVIDTAVVRSTTDTTRHVYSFNSNGKVTSDVTQLLVGDLWVNAWRISNTYDASNDMLSELYEEWSNGQWVILFRHICTYDANGNMLSYLTETWTNSQWVNWQRYTYTYDANGNTLSELQEDWENGQWVNWFRSTYTYDASGNPLSYLNEYWENGQWVNNFRKTFTYDANGNMLTEFEEVCQYDQWVNCYRSTYTYDANGNPLSNLHEYWENGQWVNNWRTTYAYDVNGNQLSQMTERWRYGVWWPVSRFTYTYDANGNMLSELRETSENGWVNDARFSYTYDLVGNLTAYWHERWVSSSWTYEDTPLKPLTDSAGNYYEYQGFYITISYRTILTALSSESENVPSDYSLSQNYPNPFNPSTTIRYALPTRSQVTLAVFNTLGQHVALLLQREQEAGYHEAVFNASDLASGVYLYRLQAGDFVQTKRLVLVR
jgi:hypothetical protein